MEKLSLREIAAQLGCPQPPEGEITRVITDSREAGPGTLFVALPGERVDGHDYINRALAAGAEAAVAEHDGDYTPAEKVLRVKSSLRALLEISALYRAKMPAKVIGITGSVGKTTTKEMVAAVMVSSFRIIKTGKGIYDLVLEHKLMSEEELHKVLQPENMVHPRKKIGE